VIWSRTLVAPNQHFDKKCVRAIRLWLKRAALFPNGMKIATALVSKPHCETLILKVCYPILMFGFQFRSSDLQFKFSGNTGLYEAVEVVYK
jgi:hypothetical protein